MTNHVTAVQNNDLVCLSVLLHCFGHFGHCPKLVQIVQRDDFRKTKKIAGVLDLLVLARILLAYKLESELTRIPVVMTWVWR
jgi:hypothetical protein